MSDIIYSVKSEVASSKIGEEMALMDLKGGTYFMLNTVGAFIWTSLATPRSAEELTSQIIGSFDIEEDKCRTDVLAILADLEDAGLVEATR